MSIIRADSIKNRAGTGAPDFPNGITVTGIVTSTVLDASVTNLTVTGNLVVGGTITYEDVTNVDSVGIITARSGIRIGTGGTVGPSGSGIVTYFGDGSQLTGIDATQIATGNTKVQTVASRIDSKIANVGILTVTAAGANVTGIVTANSFSGGGLGKLLKIHYAETTTSVLVTTPNRADTNLGVTFTPEALGSTFFIQAFLHGLNGVSNDQALSNFYMMRSIASGTAAQIEDYLYLGNYTTNDRMYMTYPLGYKDTPSYSAGQTLNYHIEVGFYTGNYSLSFRAQANSTPSQIFVYELGA